MAILNCWQCGRGVDVPLPLGRRECCSQCDAELRCCRMCAFYDTGYARDCREPMGDAVTEKTRANTCDYFQPGSGGATAGGDEAAAARDKLARLFGKSPAPGSAPGSPPGSIAAGGTTPRRESEAEAARRKLESLFKKDT